MAQETSQTPNECQQATFFSTLTGGGGKAATVIGTLAGLFGDFMTPLAAINTWLFVLTFSASLVLGWVWFRSEPTNRHNWETLFPNKCFAISIVILIALGLWFFGSFVLASKEKGIVSDYVPGIAKLQETLLGIHADVKDIKADTAELKSHTSEILQETRRIGGNIDEIGKLGGVVKNPTTAAEFYHNARIHELGGDFKSAFAAYEKYLAFDQEFLDPYESYLILLRSQRGNTAAEKIWTELGKKYPDNIALSIVGTNFLLPQEQRAELNRLVEQHKDCLPIYWEIAQSLSAKTNPNRSKLDRDYEIKYIRKILDAPEDDFLRYYLDKKQGRQLIAEMRSLVGEYTGKTEIPFRLFTEGGITVNDNNVEWIEFSFDQKNWTRVSNLEKSRSINSESYACSPTLPENSKQKWAEIHVRYQDREGKTSEIFSGTYTPPIVSNTALPAIPYINAPAKSQQSSEEPSDRPEWQTMPKVGF